MMTSDGSGLLSEHEAPSKNEKVTAEYDPTPEEKKAIKLVEKLFEKAKKHRAQYDEKWLDYYRMFRGRQWKEQRPSYRHTEVVNLVFRTLQSLIPIQVDARPRFEFLPQEPGDMEFSEILNQLAEADWTKNNWAEELLEVVYDSNIYGTGLSYEGICDEYKGPTAKAKFASADPFSCYPDPDAKDTNKGCCYFIHAEPMTVSKIKRKWPDKKDFIKPDVLDLMKGSKTDLGPIKFRSPVDNKVILEGSNVFDTANKDKALVLTCYIKPELLEDEFDEEEKTEVNEETGEVRSYFEQRAKYPNGRKIVTCNGVVLEDTEFPFDDGEIPYSRLPNYILPREFWGISEVEQLEGPQKVFNKLVSFALDVLTLMGNPIWKLHASSGVDPENLFNRPGLIVEWDGEKEPKREEGVQLQPYVLQMIDRMGEWFDSIAGSNDVTRGVQPSGITAASAITSLQESAQTRIRQKARNMDGFLQSVGRHYVSRVMQFYSVPQVVRLTANDGAQKYFRFSVETYDKEDGTQGKKAMVQNFTESGGEDPALLKVYEVRGEFDVKVSTGSALPFAKAEKEQKLLNLFDRGIVDEQEVLKGTDYPNWEAVLQRVAEKKQQAAMQEAQAQGAPPQAG